MPCLISICVPAYKRTSFLKRLLDSIAIQTFRDFEVIIADDSPDETIKELCAGYGELASIFYYRNQNALGTPENWNESIRKAKGEWIKLIHDDDWFRSADSLELFAAAIKENPEASFIFSAYQNNYLDKDIRVPVYLNRFRYRLVKKNPVTLLSSNIIGPPSVVIHRNDNIFFYDNRLKWLVDIDFYIRYLQFAKPVYIDRLLIDVGLGSEQVTKTAFRVPAVEIPEHFYLLEKLGIHQLKNILIYDAWWRLIRNLGIKNLRDIRQNDYLKPVPPIIARMIGFQNKLPAALLRIGIFSKFLMSLSFIIFFPKIEQSR
jgi:glycosyltransferase involved in cell wall biosynthesis